MASKLSHFLSELKRRKVYRVGAVYGTVGIAIALAVPDLFGAFELPNSAARLVIILIALGFPVALVLAWAYELRPEETQVASLGDRAETPSREPAAVHPREGPVQGTGLSGETSRPLEEKPAIAVLPFQDFSPDPGDAYFANGMHEEILTQLQRVKSLAVRGRTSVLRYRDNPPGLKEIAQELGVRYVLEGSARKAGDQVRLTAQLIDAERDEHLWADNYDRALSLENLISVQSDIARQVAGVVGVMLTQEDRARLGAHPTQDLEAYEYYLLGRHHIHQWSLRDIEKGLEYLRRAVEVDPGFARGHAGLAYGYSVLAAWGQPPEDTWPHARAAAERALAMDETQAEAHNALALEALSYRYDWEESEARFRRALDFNPNSVEALDWLAISLTAIWGRVEEGRAFSQRAKEADPLSLTIQYHVGIIPLWAGELEEGERAVEAMEEVGPGVFLKRHARAYLHLARGDLQRALEALERAAEVAEERLVVVNGLLGYLYGLTGQAEAARNQLRRLDELEAKGMFVDPVSRAQIHTGLGDPEAALSLLEEAYRARVHWLIYLGKMPWAFPELREEPRFRALIRRMAFPRPLQGA